MFCTNCGTKLADGLKFCTQCGKPIGISPAYQPPPQNCTNCGAQLTDGLKFCTQCGKPIGTAPVYQSPLPEPQAIPPSILPQMRSESPSQAVNLEKADTNKILKQGDFIAWLKKSVWGTSEKGTLTLYRDRLEWRGKKNNFDLPISNITLVGHFSYMSRTYLEIGDGDKETYKFDIVRVKAGDVILAALDSVNGTNGTIRTLVDRNNIEFESWRQAIDQLRGRL